MTTTSGAVILFDGVCNLCSGAVQFIIKRDPDNFFRFASLQSEFSKKLLSNFNIPSSALTSVILVKDGKAYTKSAAALMIAKHLSGAWSLLYYFLLVPSFLRDSIYSFIAANRYKWFGKKEACWLPSPALKSRFID